MRMKVWDILVLVPVALCSASLVMAQASSVQLAWDPNTESNLAGYNVYRSQQSGSGYVKLNSSLVANTTYTDSTLSAGQTFFFVVRAVNTSGQESGNSNEVQFSTPAAPNQPPVAVNDSITISEDQSAQINVVFNDSDPEGDPLTIVSVTQGVHGSVTIVASNLARYTPNANFNGSDSFTYTISDGNGNSATATVSMTINPANDPPITVSDSVTTSSGAVTINLTANDFDIDGDSLTVTQITQPANGSAAIQSASSVTYTPNAGFSGTDSFSYTISDGKGATASATVSVTVEKANQFPQATADSATTAEDQSVTVNLSANDSDPDGDPLSVTQVTQPTNGTATIQGSSSVLYVPAANFNGSDTFTYTVNDGKGGIASASVSITVTPVNDNPVATADTASTPQDQAVTINVLANDSDLDGDTLTVSQISQPAKGSAIIENGTSVRYTPNAGFFGSDSFSYTVSDGKGGTATSTVSVTVQKVNKPPVAVNDSASTPEDQAVTLNVLSNDSDPNGDPLSVTQVTQPASGSTTLVSGTSVRYTPNPNLHGSDSFSYTISDGDGGSASATVTITVTPVNDNPVATADTASTPQDQAVTVNVLANDSDVDGDALTVSQISQPAKGSAIIENGTSVRYTPNAGFFGSDSFSYTVSDGKGGTASSSVSVIVVQAGNHLPVAVNDSATTIENQPVTIQVLLNDSDPDGDPLSVVQLTAPSNGAAVTTADSTVLYTPNNGFSGTDSFSYTVSDGRGGTDTATVSLAVQPGNQAPTAANDAVTLSEDQSVTIQVLGNDSDPDGDALAVASATKPINGTAAIQGTDAVVYTPSPDFNGSDSFSYTVSDGKGGTASATVSLTALPVNDPPVAVNDSAVTVSPEPVTIHVVANDVDVDGDLLTVTGTSAPSSGSVSIQANGLLLYTPNADFLGKDSFTYTISDPSGATASATVTVETVDSQSAGQPLVLPATLNTGNSFFDDTFIGVALLNPRENPNPVTLSSVSREGTRLSKVELGQLTPHGQISFLASEAFATSSNISALSAQGTAGPIQGFCLVGNMRTSRLDGIGADPVLSTRLLFSIAKQSERQSTLLFLHNPSTEPAFDISLKLYDEEGLLLDEQTVALAPGGSLTGHLNEIFDTAAQLEEGFVQLDSSTEVQGFEILADGDNFTSFSAQRETQTARLLAPHFFVTSDGSDTSILRLLNRESRSIQVKLRAFSDSSQLIAEETLDLPAGKLLVRDLHKFLKPQLAKLPSSGALTGFLEVKLSQPLNFVTPVAVGSLTFSTNRQNSMTTLPLVADGETDSLFPHVAQQNALQLFTGLSILNPGSEAAQVELQVFDQEGRKTGERSFELAPNSRRIDLLNGNNLLGPSFEQMSGHIQIHSTRPLVTFAIFGDFSGNFLAAIEGQRPK